MKKKAGSQFSKLLNIMEILRGPHGCPWDRHQDHRSLVKYLFSEAKEVRRAVQMKDWNNLKEELGDILLQVVFHSQVAQEKGTFDISDVIGVLNRKLVRRHPHVFARSHRKLTTPEQVYRQWKEIKRREKQTTL